MTVPPLPRDWASRPLLGKAAGSAPNTGTAVSVKVKRTDSERIKVFMLLLIYGEGPGVKRTECKFQNVECRAENVEKTCKKAWVSVELKRNALIYIPHSTFNILHSTNEACITDPPHLLTPPHKCSIKKRYLHGGAFRGQR
jgi:hypothetical protein